MKKTRTVRTISVFSEEVHRQDELEMIERREENEGRESSVHPKFEMEILSRIDEENENEVDV